MIRKGFSVAVCVGEKHRWAVTQTVADNISQMLARLQSHQGKEEELL